MKYVFFILSLLISSFSVYATTNPTLVSDKVAVLSAQKQVGIDRMDIQIAQAQGQSIVSLKATLFADEIVLVNANKQYSDDQAAAQITAIDAQASPSPSSSPSP